MDTRSERFAKAEEGLAEMQTARSGRLEEARTTFETMLTYANHVGLFSEEIGPTGEQLGNFPRPSRTCR